MSNPYPKIMAADIQPKSETAYSVTPSH